MVIKDMLTTVVTSSHDHQTRKKKIYKYWKLCLCMLDNMATIGITFEASQEFAIIVLYSNI